MNIEVGKTYVTDNGTVVKIYYNTDLMGHPKHIQPFGGVIEGRGAAFYCENGIYSLSNPKSGFNIKTELTTL